MKGNYAEGANAQTKETRGINKSINCRYDLLSLIVGTAYALATKKSLLFFHTLCTYIIHMLMQ